MSPQSSLLEDLVEHMTESVAIYDRDARVLYANAAIATLFRRPASELTGKILWELFPDAIGNAFHQAFLRVAAGGEAERFEQHYPAWGRWFANRIERRGDRIHVVARDITDEVRDRRRIEALARSSAVFARDEVSLEHAMGALAAEIATLFDADCSIRLVSADRRTLDRIAVAPPSVLPAELLAATARIPMDSPLSGAAVATQQPTLWVHGDPTPPTFEGAPQKAAPYGPAALIVAPLIAGGTVIGALFIGRRTGLAPLLEDDRLLAGELAVPVGLYVSRAQRHQDIADLEQRLAWLADALPALVAFVDRDQRYLYVNAAYERWFNRPRETFLGHTIEELLGPEQFAIIAPHVATALGGTTAKFRWRPSPVNAPPRHVAVTYEPVRSQGDVIGFAVLVLDVTAETLLAEEQQRAAERMDRLLGIAVRLAAADEPADVARAVVDAVGDALEATVAAMWFVTPAGDELELTRARDFSEAAVRAFQRIPLVGSTPLVDCVLSAAPVWITSRAEYRARYPEFEAAHRPDNSPSVAFGCVPILGDGHVLGAMMVGYHDAAGPSVEERAFLEVLASHAGDALRRARLYAELREVSQTQEAMIQASPAAIILIDADGTVRSWNPAAERIFGWTADEVIGAFHPSVDAEHRDVFLANLARVIGGAVIRGQETRRRRASGELFDVELHAAPIVRSTGVTQCLAMVVDVSERKRIERGRQLVADAAAALARSLEWEKATANVVELLVADFADWACVDLLEGDKLRRIALSRARAGDGIVIPTLVAHEPERGGASASIETGTMQLMQDIDESDIKRLARDAEHEAAIRALQMRSGLSVPLKMGSRTFGAITFVSRDRNFDAVDIAIATELANQTAMSIDNARLYQQAHEANRAKDQFLAMLGHELRNPLAPISSALELMKVRSADTTREREVIARQVSHLTRLVDDLLDVSRISRGTVELERSRITVASFVNRGVELARPLIDKRSHQLTVDVPDDLIVDGDPTRLAQIVANLLTNAARYSDPGASSTVSAVREGDDIVLRVKDTGIGIAPDILPTIFDVFVQAPQAIARTTGGLGLGLTIVKNLVELHGGSVVARSAGLGHGTELEVRLPAAEATASVAIPAAPAVLSRASVRRRVLIVDDNQDAAMLLAEILDEQGHEIRTAHDGTSALRIADEFRPEVAVLDIGLPVMDGYELARQLRTHPAHGKVRLIALSGYSQVSDHARSRDAGFERHLAKPVEIETLIRLVDE